MIFIPLPFVVALLLTILLVAMLRNPDQSSGNRPFLALIALCVLQSVIVGLRWGYGFVELRYVLPVLASCLPPLVLKSFRSLIHRDEAEERPWLHFTPPIGMVALLLLAPELIDLALIVLFIGYAFAVLGLGCGGPDALDEARFDGAVTAHRALFIAAASLFLSALCDLAILLDFEWSKGANVALIVSNANLLELLLLGFTARVAARARALPASTPDTAEATSIAAQDREILQRLDGLLNEQKLFRDDNLTLSRLARRAGENDIRRGQSAGAEKCLAIHQRPPHRRSLPAAAEHGCFGDGGDVRGGVPDEVELQPRIPTGYRAQPGRLARETPAVRRGCRLIALDG